MKYMRGTSTFKTLRRLLKEARYNGDLIDNNNLAIEERRAFGWFSVEIIRIWNLRDCVGGWSRREQGPCQERPTSHVREFVLTLEGNFGEEMIVSVFQRDHWEDRVENRLKRDKPRVQGNKGGTCLSIPRKRSWLNEDGELSENEENLTNRGRAWEGRLACKLGVGKGMEKESRMDPNFGTYAVVFLPISVDFFTLFQSFW